MAPENRRNVDNVRSIIRDVISGGSAVGMIGLVFYAGKLVDQLNTMQKDFEEYKIEQNVKMIGVRNDVSVLRDWKVASTRKPFVEIDDEKRSK
jgi:hypothetical protein